jgi:hypothetical protein
LYGGPRGLDPKFLYERITDGEPSSAEIVVDCVISENTANFFIFSKQEISTHSKKSRKGRYIGFTDMVYSEMGT